VKACIVA